LYETLVAMDRKFFPTARLDVDMNSGHGANDEWAPVRDARDPQQCRMPMLSLCKEIDSW